MFDVIVTDNSAEVNGSEEWDEILDLLAFSDDEAKLIAKTAMEADYLIPEIGYEFIDGSNRVIGTIEIAWVEQKLGYLSQENKEYAEILIRQGWQLIENAQELFVIINGGEN